MDSVRLRYFAARFENGAGRLPDGQQRQRLLNLAREARVRAATREHGLLDSDPPVKSGVPQGLPRTYKPRRRGAA